MQAHEIEYKLYGDDMQFVEIELDPKESVVAEAGAMMMMKTTSKWRQSSVMVLAHLTVYSEN